MPAFRQPGVTRGGVCSALLALVCGCVLAGCSGTGFKPSLPGKAVFSKIGNPFHKKEKVITDPELGFDEFDRAQEKYKSQDFAGATGDLKQIIKKYEDYPVEEEARFLLAECHYAQEAYPRARDHYEGLCKKYPSTRYLEQSTRRLYTIGIIWLAGNKEAAPSELVQVSAEEVENPGASEHPAAAHPWTFVPNVSDRTRPVFDTTGFALKCFKSVWMYDPTGPLADDALMATAVYYVRRGNTREADYYFDLLRQEYPKSEFCQTAFVVGSDVKLANYQGPRYDGKHLANANELIQTTLALYPKLEDRERLQEKLKQVHAQAAERDFSHGQYYERRGKPQSAAIYYESVMQDYADTEWAEKARERLEAIGPQDWSVAAKTPPQPTVTAEAPGPEKRSFLSAPRLLPTPKIPAPKLWPFGKSETPEAEAETGPEDDEPQFLRGLLPGEKSGTGTNVGDSAGRATVD